MANLSNINNKFLVTTTGEVLIGQTANNGNRLQITGADGASYIYLKTDVATTGGRIGFNSDNLRVFNQQASGGLNLGTAGTTRLTINSAGVVTVGAAKRYVDSGNTQFDLEVTEGMAFGGSAFTFATIQGDSAGNGNIEICANAYPANTGTEAKITFKTATSGGGQNDKALVIKGPNVGIGNSSPSSLLNVGTSSNTEITIGDASANAQGRLRFLTSNNQKNFQIGFNYNVGGGLEFTRSTAIGGTAFTTPDMVITNDANVGIGTSSPTEKLEVKGNIVLNGQSTATGTTELDSLIFRKSHPSGASSGYYNQGLIKGVTYGGYAGGMNFYYNRSNNDGSGSYTNTQALWLNQYGNFCIGENSSSYKLRVKSGTIANNSVSNGVYISAGTSSSSHTLYAENQDGSAEFFAVRGDGEIRLNASSGHTYAAQGIRFGANATANNLDDYEEGTWTPVAYASSGTATGSYSAQLGTYTKTGRQVICMFDITLILSGTMVGFAGISGLPFTVGTTSATGGGMAGYSVNQFRSSSLFAVAGAGRQISGFPQQNASYIYCQVDNSGVNGFGSAAYATWNIGTTGRCTGYVIYFTN